MNLREPNAVAGQFVRFCVSGLINAITDFSLLNLLVKLAHLAPVWANVFSFSTAVIVSYFLNKYWTFKDLASVHLRQFPAFVVVSLVGLGLSSLLVHFGTMVLDTQTVFELSFTWSYNLSKVLSAAVVLAWNFIAYKFLVFKK